MPADPSGAVYGTIAVGALLAAESAQYETYGETVGAVLITLLVYWLARSYAESAGRRLQTGEQLTVGGIARAMVSQFSILIGAAIPLVPLLIWWAAGGPLTNAVSAAVFTSATMIVIIELVVGLRAGVSGRDLVVQTAVGAVLGLLVIALKLLLH